MSRRCALAQPRSGRWRPDLKAQASFRESAPSSARAQHRRPRGLHVHRWCVALEGLPGGHGKVRQSLPSVGWAQIAAAIGTRPCALRFGGRPRSCFPTREPRPWSRSGCGHAVRQGHMASEQRRAVGPRGAAATSGQSAACCFMLPSRGLGYSGQAVRQGEVRRIGCTVNVLCAKVFRNISTPNNALQRTRGQDRARRFSGFAAPRARLRRAAPAQGGLRVVVFLCPRAAERRAVGPTKRAIGRAMEEVVTAWLKSSAN